MVSGLQSLEQLWPGPLPETERLIFLQLKPDRQNTALQRLRAVDDFLSRRRQAAALIEQLGLGSSQFYKLVRDWKATHSLQALVPHTKTPRHRASKLDPKVIDLIRAVLFDNANASSRPPETALLRIIQALAAGQGLPVPADESIRRAVARLTLQDADLSLASVGRVAMVGSLPSTEPKDCDAPQFPEVFGGRLLLDHSTVDMIVEVGGRKFRPTISVVVDDATRLILSHHLIDRVPEPDDFLNILAFASSGYMRLQEKGINAVAGLHPVLTMRNGLSAKWSELRMLTEKARFKFDIRRAPEPVFGHVLRRSMITEIGGLRLMPRSTMQSPSNRLQNSDAGKPVIPWAEAPAFLDKAVASHNRNRLLVIPDEVLRGIRRTTNLRLNTERRDWLHYGLSVFREAWASR